MRESGALRIDDLRNHAIDDQIDFIDEIRDQIEFRANDDELRDIDAMMQYRNALMTAQSQFIDAISHK